MALSSKQQEQINVLVKKGGLSNRAIAKEVNCSESAVRTYIKKNGIEKNAIKDLAEREITNTIIGEKINAEKNALNNAEKKAYQEVLFTMQEGLNLFNNSTFKHQALVNQAQEAIEVLTKDNDVELIDQLPNLMAIGKMTETNRKQILGVTETYKHKEESEDTGSTVIQYIEDKSHA